MKRFVPFFCLSFLIVFFFTKCQKEVSAENINTVSDTTKLTAYGWAMKGDDTAYAGCIDTAYYANAGNVKLLTVAMYDADGNTAELIVTSLSGSFTKGKYTMAQGASISFTNAAGNMFAPALAGTTVTIDLTNVNDTLVEGAFTATLKDVFSGETLNIKDGKVKARIGAANPCDGGNAGPTSAYTIRDCAGITVSGAFTQGITATTDNTVKIPVNVTTAGTWIVSTAEINGLSFSGGGTFSTTGEQDITLHASGTPVAAENSTVAVTAGSTDCSFEIVVAAPVPAVFILTGTATSCSSADVQGIYMENTAVTADNKVVLQVAVTVAGAWSVTTSEVNGLTFSGSGNFAAAGAQTITLLAAGTPTASGTLNVPITAGNSTCSFDIMVAPPPSPAAYSLVSGAASCSMATVQGTYTQNVSAGITNTVTLQVDVVTAGFWNVATTPVSGLSFSGSGTFTATGIQTITLNASGVPAAAGTLTIPVTAGTSDCSFAVTVVPAPVGIYNCKIDGVFTSFVYRAAADNRDIIGNPDLSTDGYTAEANGKNIPELHLSITNNDATPIQTGTYDINHFASLTGYMIGVSYSEVHTDNAVTVWTTSSIIFSSNPPFTITITSISNDRVKGTFSGKVTNVFEGSNKTKVITEGVFDLPIQ